MDSMPPLEGLAGGDVSDELAAILRSIAQITADDEPKYSAAVCRRLTRWIVCRSYAGPLRELCHLIVASDRVVGSMPGAQGYEILFWGMGAARAAAFRAAFQNNASSDRIERLEAGIRATYADGAFGIAYTRMPFLSALMEFLVSVFGYADLDAQFRALPAGKVTKGAVDALANDFARHVYQYLSTHLPTAQSHRKFRAVMSYLRHVDGGTVGAHSIDDDAVLSFWIFASMDGRTANGVNRTTGDVKSFKSVFHLMVAVRDALAAAAQASAIDRARPIGTDRSAGEIDPGEITPDSVDAALGPIHERQAPLDVLRAAPARGIKFLKQTETDAIAPIIDYGDSALALPLSILRLQVMGPLQARLTEALRRGEDPLALSHLDRLNSVPAAYGDFAGHIDRITGQLLTSLFASLHHLVGARREEAITVLLHLRPDMDLTPLAPLFEDPGDHIEPTYSGQIVHLRTPDTDDRFMHTLTAGLDHCPELVALIDESGGVAKRMTRKGFKDADWPDKDHATSDRADACAAASDALIQIRESLLKFCALLQRLGGRHGGWDAQYLSDHDIFSAQFRALYGDR